MDTKAILDYLGITIKDGATIDDFKSIFDKTFLKVDSAKDHPDVKRAIEGEVIKQLATETKRVAKSFAIDFNEEESKQPIFKMLETALGRQSETLNNEIEGLKKKVGEPTEALKDLEAKLAKAQERADAEARLKSDLAAQVALKEKEVTDFKRNFKLNSVREQLFKSLPYSDTATELMRKGFNTLVSEKYIIDLDDQEQPYIADAATKARIKDPSKHDAYLSPEVVLAKELADQKLAKVVDPNQQKPASPMQPPQQPPFNPSGVRRIHPAAAEAVS